MNSVDDVLVRAERGIQSGLAQLPPWISRFFGYRGKPQPPSRNLLVCIWGFVGAFGGLGILFAVFTRSQYFTSRAVPPIVASYVSNPIWYQPRSNMEAGSIGDFVLWCHWRSASTTTCIGLRTFLQRSGWRHHLRYLQLQIRRRRWWISRIHVGGSLSRNVNRFGSHAFDQDNSPTRWGYCSSATGGPYHPCSSVVLPSCVTPVLSISACERASCQQYPAAVSKILDCTDSSCSRRSAEGTTLERRFGHRIRTQNPVVIIGPMKGHGVLARSVS